MNDIKRIYKYIISLIICLFLILFISPKKVYADKKEETDKNVYCQLCQHRDSKDPLYQKERQFYQKVSAIKSIFGDSIDEVALAATVLHRYNSDVAYTTEYDENFDKNNYQMKWADVKKGQDEGKSKSSELGVTEEEKAEAEKRVSENRKLDLLTTAALVMIDSNNFGKYSDVCYRDALAGDKLVGNNNKPFGDLLNFLVCGAAQKVNVVSSPSAFLTGLVSGDNFLVTSQTVANRLVDTQSVCENGYVGGLYGVQKTGNDEITKARKLSQARQIIDFANYYKRLYGKLDEQNSCVSNTASATGTFADWKQADDRWGGISLGGSSSVARAGCLVTSISMQIARSGTAIGTLPSGYSEFNPGAFVTTLNENGGFVGGGNFAWTGHDKIAPNWNMGEVHSAGISDNNRLAEVISQELSTAAEDKYQKFIVLQIHHSKSSQHWVAVNAVENGQVTIFDPGSPKGHTLDENYSGWVVDTYRVMYATDVNQGQIGTTTTGGCGGDDMSGLASFLAYIEGSATCNYQGQGEDTGYKTEYLSDGNGYTAGLGLTHWKNYAAEEVGYGSYLDDLPSGCVNKNYIDKMLTIVMSDYGDKIDEYAEEANVTLSGPEKAALISVEYGGNTLAKPIVEAYGRSGKESNEVLDAFKHSYNPQPQYRFGLGIRRVTEYEVFMTGNYNAAKPYDHFSTDGQIQAASMDEIKSYWPTQRDNNLWDGTVSSTSGSNSSNLDDYECKDGKPVKKGDKDKGGSIASNFAGAEDVFFAQFNWPDGENDWYDIPYAGGTVSNSGCGLVAMTMCYDILKGQSMTPRQFLEKRQTIGSDEAQYHLQDGITSMNDYNKELFGIRTEEMDRSLSEMKQVLSQGGVILASSGNTLGNNAWHNKDGSNPSYQHDRGHFVCIWAYKDGAFLMKDPSKNADDGNNIRYTDEEMENWNNNAKVPSAIWAVYPE